MDFEDFLKDIGAIGENSDKESKKFSSPKEAKAALQKFLNKEEEDFKVGDFIERNEYGKARYKFPKKNQVCQIVEILPQTWDEGNRDDQVGENIVAVLAAEKNHFATLKVDGRFFQKARDVDNVHFLSRKKK